MFAGIFFLPFNSFEGISSLGEFSRDSSTIFFLLAAFILALNMMTSGKVIGPFKNPLFFFVLVLIFWFVISTLLNSLDISKYYFKQTSGFSRTIRQYFVLIISAIVLLLTYYNVFISFSAKTLLFKIRRILLFSFVIVLVYAFLEILILKFNVLWLIPVVELFNYVPFVDVYIDIRNFRISSITFESPALATYLFFISGWMFSYVFTEKGLKKYIPGMLTIVLTLFSGSRAGLLIILIQAIGFGYFLIRKKKYQIIFVRVLKYSMLAVTLIFLVKGRTITNYFFEKATSFDIEDDTHAVSNKSRFGIQYANFQVFLLNPIYGVGIGQQAFVAKDLYPKWATEDNWEFRLKYFNEEVKSFPPGYNIYIRILAEAGIIGFIIFSLLLLSILYVAHAISKDEDEGRSILGIIVFVSILGVIFNWLKMDTYRTFNFWINLALLLAITRNKIKLNLNDRNI